MFDDGFRKDGKTRHEYGAGPDAGTGQGVKVRICERSLITSYIEVRVLLGDK